MAAPVSNDDGARLDILTVSQGQWGERIADNIEQSLAH